MKGFGLELKPDTMNINVTYGLEEHVVSVPSGYTFGDLKSILVQRLNLDAERHRLLFRGKEKENEDDLQEAGMKNGSKVLLIKEDTPSTCESIESVTETSVVSIGDEAVACIRQEVDNLSMQVEALECVVDSKTKIDDKDFVYITEMLMRQLLKLDSIEAEGKGRAQRKSEVNRVQSLVDRMDSLRMKNSSMVENAAPNGDITITTQWETFESTSSDTSSMRSTPISLPPEPGSG